MTRYSIALEEQLKLARELRDIGQRTGENFPVGATQSARLGPGWRTNISDVSGKGGMRGVRDGYEDFPMNAQRPGDRELYDALGGVVELATPYFVSSEMVKVITGAMPSLPDSTSLVVTDLPSKAGFIWLDTPVPLSPITPGEYQHLLRCIIFSPAISGGIELVFFGYSTQPNKGPLTVKLGGGRSIEVDDFNGLTRIAWQLWNPSDNVGENKENVHLSGEFLEAHGERDFRYSYVDAEEPFYKTVDVDPIEYVKLIDTLEYELRRLAAAVIHFMGQRVVSLSRRSVDRSTRRRIPEWKEPEVVQVELLRRHSYPNAQPEGGADKEGVEWSCRWIVSGHWRNQWYPSEGRHKPLWIQPYVKGPDSMPIKGNTKIFAVIR